MTNSTAPKKKGPIRTGAVVPSLIIFALIYFYFALLFDSNLRKGLEYVGTQINGAEVNIGALRTSFFNASLEIRDIQVTDKEKPHRNVVQVGTIRFKMLWDGLLRAKIVIDDASILNIQALSNRKSPGYVVPPPPPEPPKGSGALARVQSEVIKQTQKQLNGNFLSDIAAVLGGTDSKAQLAQIQGDLKSNARITELQKELNEKKLAWEKKIKEMPQAKEIEALGQRAKALKFDTKNPAEFAKNLKEAQEIFKEAEKKVKTAEANAKDLRSDMGQTTDALKDLEKMVNEDLKDLQAKFKIPDVSAKDFSTQLFMAMLERRLVGLSSYVATARKYMPPPKTKEQKLAEKSEEFIPPQRGQGQTFRFPVTTGYPLFWLKRAALSSQVDAGEYSGNLKGEIVDLNSDPEYLKKPTILSLTGEFPNQGILGIDGKIIIDHTSADSKDSMIFKVASFPVENQVLSSSKDVGLAIKKAVGSTYLNAMLAQEKLTLTMRNEFQKVEFDLVAKEKLVQDIFGKVLVGIPTVTLNADVSGSFSSLNIGINSNLGEALSNGFKAQLEARLNEAKENLRKMIDSQIGANRAKLTADLQKATGDVNKILETHKAEIDKALAEIKKSSSSPDGKKKLEQEGKKLLKKLGF